MFDCCYNLEHSFYLKQSYTILLIYVHLKWGHIPFSFLRSLVSNPYFGPERAPSRQSGIGGVEGHNMKETSSPGSPALWAGSFTLPIFHESFFLTPRLFSLERRNICTATLRIVDWNISIL